MNDDRAPVRILIAGIVITLAAAFLAPTILGPVAPHALAWLLA